MYFTDADGEIIFNSEEQSRAKFTAPIKDEMKYSRSDARKQLLLFWASALRIKLLEIHAYFLSKRNEDQDDPSRMRTCK